MYLEGRPSCFLTVQRPLACAPRPVCLPLYPLSLMTSTQLLLSLPSIESLSDPPTICLRESCDTVWPLAGWSWIRPYIVNDVFCPRRFACV